MKDKKRDREILHTIRRKEKEGGTEWRRRQRERKKERNSKGREEKDR